MSDWAKIKSSSEVVLEGIAVELERRDGTVSSITLTDAKGGTVKVAISHYASLEVLVKAPAQVKKVSVVSGTIADVPVSTTIEGAKSSYDVTAKVRDMQDAGVADVTVTERDDEIPF